MCVGMQYARKIQHRVRFEIAISMQLSKIIPVARYLIVASAIHQIDLRPSAKLSMVISICEHMLNYVDAAMVVTSVSHFCTFTLFPQIDYRWVNTTHPSTNLLDWQNLIFVNVPCHFNSMQSLHVATLE